MKQLPLKGPVSDPTDRPLADLVSEQVTPLGDSLREFRRILLALV